MGKPKPFFLGRVHLLNTQCHQNGCRPINFAANPTSRSQTLPLSALHSPLSIRSKPGSRFSRSLRPISRRSIYSAGQKSKPCTRHTLNRERRGDKHTGLSFPPSSPSTETKNGSIVAMQQREKGQASSAQSLKYLVLARFFLPAT